MTCYMRQMQWLLDAVELDYDAANRKRMDRALRTVLEIPSDHHCPQVWAAVKALPDERRADLVGQVRDVLAAGT